ncbi:RagB/SusD family nutrient uptake outer membrane protein [Hymenobacter sp. GOD-10R]|uniref:RagB/SusD family nutrient uptake outer membrane protein n=1 Tax=Hymenobacter sp. GOD-10R TaxID=3093922 RepID=UPI002D76BB41|nr:RagB/SusD family nutrient uptake outer membrane protein [Hymenobacter sp. GOD-10R]WRQ29535.1 RagB/SusD family nutrient uptake outer membrane protein [Hymenobacter sp. GOD-10R]
MMTFPKLFTKLGVAGLLGLGLLSTTSCNKEFIDLNDPTRIPTTEGYTDSLSILNGVTAAYAGLQDVYGKSGSNNGLFVFAEVPSDNSTSVISGQNINEFDFFTVTSTNLRLQSQWTVTYRTIARCNVVLNRAPAVKLTAAIRNRYYAEVRFVRALSYFNAVQIWGDVPLVTSEIATIPNAYQFGRTAAAQVYAQIEEDLRFAADNLPVTQTTANLGRATKGAAQGLLGKVYLTQKKYPEAAAVLKQVIDANTYALQASYANVFSITNEMNNEILFAVRYSKGGLGVGSPFANYFAVTPALVGNVGTSDQFNTIHPDLVAAFTASGTADTRAAASYGSTPLGGQTVYYTKKYADTPTSSLDAENDWIVLRYADVLLLYAEALNEQGTTAQAVPFVNRVRTRAGVPSLATTLSQADLRLAIENERRLELNMEGQRWFDLVRTGRAIPVMNAFFARYNIRPNNGTTGAAIQIQAYQLLQPVPIQEIQTNPILTQNPGYN